jgi:hypothetical protein
VNDSDVVPPVNGIVGAPNVFVRLGGATTVSDAFDVFPVPPSAEETVTELSFTPADVPVTFTENMHVSPAISDAPVSVTAVAFGAAAIVPPSQLPLKPLGVDTTTPAGNVSANAIPVSGPFAAGFVMVKPSDVDPFSGTVAAPNAFVICTAPAVTLSVAVAGAPLPPSFEETVDVVFTFAPAVVPVTASETVHDALAASVAPLRLTKLDPDTAEIVPGGMQLWLNMLLVATTRPAGNVSV